MTDCNKCDTPDLCFAFREAGEYIAPDGKLRQIVGCNYIEYLYGDILTDKDILEFRTPAPEGDDSKC